MDVETKKEVVLIIGEVPSYQRPLLQDDTVCQLSVDEINIGFAKRTTYWEGPTHLLQCRLIALFTLHIMCL